MTLVLMLLACVQSAPPPMETPTPTQAAPEPTPEPTPTPEAVPAAPERVVAFGDVHGDLSAAKRALTVAGLIDAEGAWIGGKTVAVQVGDQLDRGDDEPEILALFETLRTQAREAGGAFFPLLGNHEVMNVAVDFRYVTKDGFADYASTPIENLRGKEKSLPDHMHGRLAAFYPGGPAAQILSEHKVTVTVGDTLFVHGGVLPTHVEYGLDKINQETSTWMREGGPIPAFLTGEDAPIWSRHYSNEPDPGDCALARSVLDTLGLKRMVVAHTVHKNGIAAACDNTIWRVDTGMAAHYGGVVQALEIRGDEVKVLAE